MANLDFCDKHNMVAYLQKSEGSEGFHQIIDFLTTSYIRTWKYRITATIDGKVKVVSEASIRRHIKLEDSDGISILPTSEIFKQLALIGVRFYTVKVQQSQLSPITHPSVLHPPHNHQLYHPLCKQPMLLKKLSPCPMIYLSQKFTHLEVIRVTRLTYGAAYTKLIMKVKKLEHKVKSSKARRRARLVVSEDEDELEDPSKRGRKISHIDEDEGITLVQMSAQTQGRHDPEVKIAAESLVYIRRSAAKRKDKGKAIMKEAEPVQKKTKTRSVVPRHTDYRTSHTRPTGHRALTQRSPGRDTRNQAGGGGDKSKGNHAVHEHAQSPNCLSLKARLLVELINERKRKFAQQRAEQRRNKPMTQAQQRTYMCNYIKNMGSHTLQQLKKLSFDEVKELFETTMKRVNTFTPMKSDDTVPKVVAGSSKIDVEQELNQERSKRQKIGEGSEPAEESKDELSQEQLQQLMIIVPEEGMNVEALQTKYPIIDWEVYTKDSRMYWKIIRVGNHTEVYQIFEDMLKNFDRDDLVKLWSLVHERFNSTEPTEDKERELWVELKRLLNQ
ncbi:hypothetical protein Tco_0670746 [Tanacetum coccineum]